MSQSSYWSARLTTAQTAKRYLPFQTLVEAERNNATVIVHSAAKSFKVEME